MGDAENGKKLFTKLCMTCHTAEKGGRNKDGPNLFGVAGRKIGSFPGYNFSDPMKKKGGTWDDDSLDKYLEKPKQFIPGGRAVFPGIKKEKERQDVIAYLKTLK